MASSFVAYIDESGDDGFVFKPDGKGSSRWLVLSAVVIRKSNDYRIIEAMRAARTALGKPPKFVMHFLKMQHHHILPVCALVGQLPVRIVSVIAHKPSVPDIKVYEGNKNRLYHYLTRLLVERLSWICRDHRKPGDGDGTMEMVFSNRAAMSYEELRDYFRLLKTKTTQDMRIHWGSVPPENVRSEPHERLAGLQFADFVASGTRLAVEPRYGIAEFAYIRQFSSRLYRHQKKLMPYGLKFYPDLETLKPSHPHLVGFDGL